MKTLSQIKNVKPWYFVSINDMNEYECGTLNECKKIVSEFVKEHKEECKRGDYEIYIGMYNISICSEFDKD